MWEALNKGFQSSEMISKKNNIKANSTEAPDPNITVSLEAPN